MEKKIELEFDNTIVRISGNDFGRHVFKNQVQPNIIDFPDKQFKYIIVFPPNIDYIGSSFIQGFIKEICEKIKRERFYEYFEIEGTDKLKENFRVGLFDI